MIENLFEIQEEIKNQKLRMSNEEIKNLYLDSYHRSNFFIGGQWVAPISKNVIEIISPSTEELVSQNLSD